MQVVGIAGQCRNGKTTIGEYLRDIFNQYDVYQDSMWRLGSFADPVKQIYMDAFDVDITFLEEWKIKTEPPDGFQKTVRESLMFIGDGFRQIKPDAWTSLFFRKYKDSNVIIGDVRYIQEVKEIKKHNGIIIFVWRPGYENDIDHPSENQLRYYVDRLLAGDLVEGPQSSGIFDYVLINDCDLSGIDFKLKSNVIPFLNSRFY